MYINVSLIVLLSIILIFTPARIFYVPVHLKFLCDDELEKVAFILCFSQLNHLCSISFCCCWKRMVPCLNSQISVQIFLLIDNSIAEKTVLTFSSTLSSIWTNPMFLEDNN